mmetsp:Transcript_7795/g.16159  ORF Transcript_7795/g.16159 Transcript_7795/m.16159 type:complete len:231 (+) Transcript_7795:1202-1894(+)
MIGGRGNHFLSQHLNFLGRRILAGHGNHGKARRHFVRILKGRPGGSTFGNGVVNAHRFAIGHRGGGRPFPFGLLIRRGILDPLAALEQLIVQRVLVQQQGLGLLCIVRHGPSVKDGRRARLCHDGAAQRAAATLFDCDASALGLFQRLYQTLNCLARAPNVAAHGGDECAAAFVLLPALAGEVMDWKLEPMNVRQCVNRARLRHDQNPNQLLHGDGPRARRLHLESIMLQ